jgi:biopolymer transport protein ExbD
MQIPRSSRSGDVSINMTPMIDVVFQLIIFFLVSSHLARQEVQMKLPLPEAASGEKETDPSAPRLTINLLADGTLQLSGRSVTRDELPAWLAERVRDLGKDVEVRIRSDRTTPYELVEPVLVACARAGVWNVTFAVYHDEEVR